MKVYLYTINDCQFCSKIKSEIKKLPSKYSKPSEVEYKDLSKEFRQKYNITIFPTVVFVGDNGNMLDKIDGYVSADELIEHYEKVATLEKLLNKEI